MADYSTEGRTPYAMSGRCDYVEYLHEGLFLSFERFGALSWEISTGSPVPADLVTAYREGDDAPPA